MGWSKDVKDCSSDGKENSKDGGYDSVVFFPQEIEKSDTAKEVFNF